MGGAVLGGLDVLVDETTILGQRRSRGTPSKYERHKAAARVGRPRAPGCDRALAAGRGSPGGGTDHAGDCPQSPEGLTHQSRATPLVFR